MLNCATSLETAAFECSKCESQNDLNVTGIDDILFYTILQNKRKRWLGGGGCPSPPPIILERLNLPQ